MDLFHFKILVNTCFIICFNISFALKTREPEANERAVEEKKSNFFLG